MDPKNLTRLADAAERAGTTVPDVLAVCTRGDDLHLDIYVTPPLPSGWPGEEWYEEEHLDQPRSDGQGFEGQNESVGRTHVTDPIALPLGALRPWSGSVSLGHVTIKEGQHGPCRWSRAVHFDTAIEIPGDLLEVSKQQWAGWIAQRTAEVQDADQREQLTRRVTAAVQAAADAEFVWKTEEAATALSTRITVSRQSLSRWRSKAAERGLPVPARRRAVGRSRADLWLPDVGLLVAWADLLEIEGVRGRGPGGAQPDASKVAVEPKPGRRKKRAGRSHEDNIRRLAEARKKGR